jgi:peptidoglycan/LPS O-acetylase OafA/YrhL
LVPTIATIFIINSKYGIVNEYILNNRLIIFVGKISYALYLFHNSFIFYANYFGNRHINQIITFFLAVIVTKLIEDKIRASQWNMMVEILCCLMFMIFLVALSMYHTPEKWSQQ